MPTTVSSLTQSKREYRSSLAGGATAMQTDVSFNKHSKNGQFRSPGARGFECIKGCVFFFIFIVSVSTGK